MATFYIQEQDDSLERVSHDEFFEALNGEDGYLCYKQGGRHIALLPSDVNTETIRFCRQADNAESNFTAYENRCRDEKGRLCRFQHDANGRVIRNEKGHAVHAKCGDCPRDGWIGGKRENCCIRNYCKTDDCVYCPRPRECHSPHSLEWLMEDKSGSDWNESGGFYFEDSDADIQSALETEELESALLTAIGELPAKERAVLKAIYWDGLSRRAYSAESGVPFTTVKRLHNKAVATLKEILKDFF